MAPVSGMIGPVEPPLGAPLKPALSQYRVARPDQALPLTSWS